jgi:hypothetical protein
MMHAVWVHNECFTVMFLECLVDPGSDKEALADLAHYNLVTAVYHIRPRVSQCNFVVHNVLQDVCDVREGAWDSLCVHRAGIPNSTPVLVTYYSLCWTHLAVPLQAMPVLQKKSITSP